jgi:hypothetical protein
VAYVGNQPARGQWRKLTDISASFNGVLTTFTTSVPPGTSEYYVTAGSASQLLVSLGGVIQQPDVDYTVSTNSITFTTPPTGGLSFFGVLCGDALNVGAPADGSVTTSKLAGSLSVGLTGGSASTPALFFTGDANTGIFSPAADTIAFAEGGVESARIDSSGRLLVGTSTNITGYRTQISTNDGSNLSLLSYSASVGDGVYLLLNRSKSGTTGTQSVVASGDLVGTIRFRASDGTDFINAAAIEAIVDGTPGTNDMPGRLVFSTTADGASSPTERMRINASGYLKATNNGGSYFGVSNPYHELIANSADEIALHLDNVSATTPYGLRIRFSNASPNDGSRYFLACQDSTTARAIFYSNGGLGNYSANNVNLSDINAKKDIALAIGTWDCLKEWEIVNYRYKDQSADADLNLGVIAQQIAESCPEVITIFQEAKEATETEPAQEERLGVKDQQMMWMAIKALQEAQLRIETLESEVAALKAS